MTRWYYALTGDIAASQSIHFIQPYVYLSAIFFSISWLLTILLMIQRKFILKLRNLATHDSMTNLYNRRQFEEDLLYNSQERSGTLFIIDLNRFKHINDKYGHQIGDSLLKKISKILVSEFSNDNIYRIGGDEFAILSESEKEIEMKKQILKTMNQDITVDSIEITISASVGAALLNNYSNAEDLYRAADQEMYKLKIEQDKLKKQPKK
jgi:diguanylate cyclase